MNKANTTQQNTTPKKINLEFGNKLIYFACGVFIAMVFCVVGITQSLPAKAEAQPCYVALNNQYSICYAEYLAQTTLAIAPKEVVKEPVKVAQNSISPNDFVAPAQSSAPVIEPVPNPTSTPTQTPTPVEKPTPTPKPTQNPVTIPTPVTNQPNQNTTSEPQKQSSASQSSSSESSQSQSSSSQTSSSSSSSESTPEFGLGQTGVASISQIKTAPDNKNTNSWVNTIVQNWIYILVGIVVLILGILVYSIVHHFQKKPKQNKSKSIPLTQVQYAIPDLNDLTAQLDNMPPEVEIDHNSEYLTEFATNIPTFGSDDLTFGIPAEGIVENIQPFEPIENILPEPTPANIGNFSSLIQERLKNAQTAVPTPQSPDIIPPIQEISPYKQALNNQLWAEYNQAISGKKSKPFPITNKDRIFFAYCLAYTTVKVYVVDWDLWGE